MTHWADLQRAVTAGTMALKDAMASMPRLARVGGACPCANSVRWVVEVAARPGSGESVGLNP